MYYLQFLVPLLFAVGFLLRNPHVNFTSLQDSYHKRYASTITNQETGISTILPTPVDYSLKNPPGIASVERDWPIKTQSENKSTELI